jgi:hypothetical protein
MAKIPKHAQALSRKPEFLGYNFSHMRDHPLG